MMHYCSGALAPAVVLQPGQGVLACCRERLFVPLVSFGEVYSARQNFAVWLFML